jgi:hypothetical protein
MAHWGPTCLKAATFSNQPAGGQVMANGTGSLVVFGPLGSIMDPTVVPDAITGADLTGSRSGEFGEA